jgi:hypothetical protein
MLTFTIRPEPKAIKIPLCFLNATFSQVHGTTLVHNLNCKFRKVGQFEWFMKEFCIK